MTYHSLRVLTRPTCQPHRPTQCGRATRNVSQQAHDFEENAWSLISSGMIPRVQPCSTTRHMGRKSTKELLSLVPHSRVFFCRPCNYAHRPKSHDIDGQAWLYPKTQGLPRLWLASISHCKSFTFFLFFEIFEARSNYTLMTTKVLTFFLFF
jgi:hypothetical protein